MRTLQIGDFWFSEEQGGLSRYFYDLLRHLPATGVQSHGLVVGSPRVSEASGGLVRSFARADDALPRRLRAVRRATREELANFRPDLLATHFAIYGMPIADVLRGMPNVVHFHGPWAGESGVEGGRGLSARAKAWSERLVYNRATRLIVLSEAFRQELIRGYAVPADRIRIVPGGVDAVRFRMERSRSEARASLGWPHDRPILLTVRRLVRRMGLENLVAAMDAIRREVPETLLLVGGSGPIAAELADRIAERGLQQHVRLLGRIPDDDLPMAYRAADLTVVPTAALEGFGLITLESLACGTPVYVTPVGGLAEVVAPFDASCVFDDASTAAIVDRLLGCLKGRLPMPTPAACRAYAVDHFSWPEIARQVRDVYAEALTASG